MNAASAGWRGEILASLKLALPIGIGFMAEMAMGIADTIMAGRLGAPALAAAGLGAQLMFVPNLLAMGALASISAVGAQAHGAQNPETVSRVARQGLRLALLLSIPVIAIMLTTPYALGLYRGIAPHFDADIDAIRALLLWAAPSVPAFLCFTALRNTITLLGRPTIVTIITILAVPVLIASNWLFMYGNLGFPRLGVAAIGLGTSIVSVLRLIAIVIYIERQKFLRGYRFFAELARHDTRIFRDLLRIGGPIAAAYLFESGMFIASSVLIAGFGNAALAASNMLINVSSATFMIPYAIGQAGTVRVGYEIGAGRPFAARRAGWVAPLLAMIWMLGAAIVMLTMPQTLIGIFLDLADPANAAAIAICLGLFPIAAAFQIFDGTQVTMVGVLRGYKDTKIPMLITFIGYWPIGIGGGWLLAYHLNLGPAGLWWGLALGLAAAAAMLTLRFLGVSARHAAGQGTS